MDHSLIRHIEIGYFSKVGNSILNAKAGKSKGPHFTIFFQEILQFYEVGDALSKCCNN